jgi:hypothetical protein
VLLSLFLAGCSGDPLVTEGNDVTEPAVASEIAGWQSSRSWESYDTESIYAYIDGHAEVYLAFGMRRCLSRRYTGPDGEPDIVLDLFEQASPADAFGVFTHDREGEAVDIGQGGRVREGWLSFWKGRWFGSVYAEGVSEASAEAMRAIGAAAAVAITEVGERPPLLGELPRAGLDEDSVRFLHTQEILNTVVYLGYENPLRLEPDVDAVVGRYERDDGAGWLLLVEYPTVEHAEIAEESASGAGIAVRRQGSKLAAVLAPEPPEAAEGMLESAWGGER